MTRRVVILEPDLEGHHAFWLAMLIEGFRRADWEVEWIGPADESRLRVQQALQGYVPAGRLTLATAGGGESEWLAQARQLAVARNAELLFIAFLDRFWSALISAVGGGSGPRLEGIWFHPHALDRRWRYAPPLDRRWRERGRLHRWLKGPVAPKALGRLWFLAAEALERWRAEVPAVPGDVLPDPWERRTGLSREEARERLGLEQGRRIFLHLGSSERRKGLPDLLQAYEVALTEADRSARPLLLRVGPNERLRGRDRVRLARLVGRGDARVVEGFVPAEDLPAYFAACDWIVIPYRKFRYSSGVLANAAGMGRPVIAPAYGEIGRRVAGEGLGGLYREGSRRGLARRLIEAFAGGAESRPPKGPGPGDFVAVIESRARGAR